MRFPADVPVTQMAKDVIKLMLNRDPEQRLGLLAFMDLEYYSIDDAEFDRRVAEVVQARQQQIEAEEEKKNQE